MAHSPQCAEAKRFAGTENKNLTSLLCMAVSALKQKLFFQEGLEEQASEENGLARVSCWDRVTCVLLISSVR